MSGEKIGFFELDINQRTQQSAYIMLTGLYVNKSYYISSKKN